ncbi:transporter [Phenylobacterium deserti]|uniref:Transporter n=2 Tax=Phenylobacterium deserti TaxID=1914756 RepID=A0A328AFK2_9CAUL|nr:transporter [Phenylobacterium deserti]
MALLVGTTQGLGINIVTANLPAIQGSLGATPTEGAWLLAAYYATSISLSALLVKFRFQFGLHLFADLGLMLFIVVTAAHLFADDLRSAVALRAAQGVAAAPLTSLAIVYMMNAWPESRRPTAVAFGMACSQIGVPLARVISPDLLQIGDWHGLYLLELGLAIICLAGVNLFRLPPAPRIMKFEWGDALSFALFAPGLGLLAVALSMGRYVWWTEAPWIGVCLALSLPLIGAAIIVELHRQRPLLDLRWLSSGEMIRLFIAIILFRIALSEQTVGAVGMLQTLGVQNEQLATLYWIELAAMLAGFTWIGLTLKPARPLTPLMFALLLIIAAAWTDAHATNLTRPAQLYVTQGMMAFAGAFFLPPAMLYGVSQAMARSQAHFVSFVMLFSAGQNLGGLIGSAFLGTFVTMREKFHSNQLTQGLTLADPQVAARVRQLAGAYAHTLSDARLRNAEGLALLQQQATREAYVLAYNDAFLLIAALATLTLVWILVLRLRIYVWRRRQARTAAQAA